MIIIETCPECGHDLMDEVICTYPPIPRKSCPRCHWYWEGEPEQVMRVPFGGNSFVCDKSSYRLHGNMDCECINADSCMVNNLAGSVFTVNQIDLDSLSGASHYDIEAAIERIQKYLKE
jgi:hypothetical protein